MRKRKKDFRVKLKNFTVILLKEFYIADIMTADPSSHAV